MSSLSKMRTSSTGSSAGAINPTLMEIGWVNDKGKGKGKEKEKYARARERAREKQ